MKVPQPSFLGKISLNVEIYYYLGHGRCISLFLGNMIKVTSPARLSSGTETSTLTTSSPGTELPKKTEGIVTISESYRDSITNVVA